MEHMDDNTSRRRMSSRVSGCGRTSRIYSSDGRRMTITSSTQPFSRNSEVLGLYFPDKRRMTVATNTFQSGNTSKRNSESYSNIQSQWEILMRKFSKDCKVNDHYCNSYSDVRSQGEKLVRKFSKEYKLKELAPIQGPDIDPIMCETRPLKKFTTGSTYEGTWDAIGICGYGTYTFPNGVVYQGEFEDNMFHGDGELRYPDGVVLRGRWNYGELVEKTIVFPDGVHYKDHDWEYCLSPDRRYAREYKEGIKTGDNEAITKDGILRDIPPGTYDVGDGYYDPATGNVMDYNDNTKVLRCVGPNLKKWIEENCRKCPNTSVGPRQEFYKEWVEPALKLPNAPPPCCLSESESGVEDFCSYVSGDSMWRSRVSGLSGGRKLKFDPFLKLSVNQTPSVWSHVKLEDKLDELDEKVVDEVTHAATSTQKSVDSNCRYEDVF